MKPNSTSQLDEASIRRTLAALGEGLFDDASWVGEFEIVAESALPASARTLLAHGGHMTATLRSHYGSAIQLAVSTDFTKGDVYKRRIVLTTPSPRRVVELGVVRIDLRFVPAPIKAAILDKRTPLGDVLAAHGVLTRVETTAFLKFRAGGMVVECFERGPSVEAYGRLATIHCNGDEAIELLEVVAV